MDSDKLRAGEFGAAAGLSPKALRLYAELGLLVPAEIDPGSGYRWFRQDQIRRARLIGRLRRLGLPLARIGRLADLSAPDRALELRGWLRTQRRLLDDRAAVIEAFAESADDELRSLVALREVPATKVLSRSRRIDSTMLRELTETTERDARAHLRASGVDADAPRLVYFQDLVTPDCAGTVEVAVPFHGTVEPVDDLVIRLVPAHTAAYLPVPPRCEDLPLILRVYDVIDAWIAARPDLTCVGHSYEITPGTAGSRFDVAYPVAP